ncbi:glycosyltransferase [Elizabethkingia argentiflava]|uniref:Glycosyltransferase n=1 Tax=Elizabethkingia argenteiflava TaxID=2681556 RepID=A0A845PVE7_9FLAO|nr:glycosyltransferase family 2 protein [Elizabethkingia argenteiflava]NAW51103.1 glycosyltransferase [Elizabethkingia argenteiflava]
MKLAIAILNWNGKSWLEKFLPNILTHSTSADIYIIDNASTDDSVRFISSNFPGVGIIENAYNYGFAGGYNEGLKNIEADIFCLLNSDVEVSPHWLEPILNIFERSPEVAAVQPKILDYNKKNFFEFAGAGGGLIDHLGYPYCRGRVFESIEEDCGQYDDETEIFWASGCCFFIRAQDFWLQKGFDTSFFAHQEEIDLCWRLKNSGRRIFYTGKSSVYHVGGGTLHKENPQKTYLNIRNNLCMMLKNLPAEKLYLILIRLCLDGVAGIYFLFKYGFSHTWAVIKAHFGFYRRCISTYKGRHPHPIKNYYQSKWLIIQHFL